MIKIVYSTIAQIRLLTSWNTSTISDANLTLFITHADRMISRAFSTKVYRERNTWNSIDGSNKLFKVKHIPIADIDADSDIDGSDISVYYATYDAERNVVYGSAQTVTSVNAHDGIITMTTAPTSTTAEAGLYVSYSYTSPHIDYNLITLAANYLAAHFASMHIQGEAPDFQTTEATFLRRDIAGAPDEWLRKAIMAINGALGSDKYGIGFRAVKVE